VPFICINGFKVLSKSQVFLAKKSSASLLLIGSLAGPLKKEPILPGFAGMPGFLAKGLMAFGHWQLAIGLWPLAIGHLSLAIGHWSLVVGKKR
jgi:hypothetical protein